MPHAVQDGAPSSRKAFRLTRLRFVQANGAPRASGIARGDVTSQLPLNCPGPMFDQHVPRSISRAWGASMTKREDLAWRIAAVAGSAAAVAMAMALVLISVSLASG